MAQPDISLMCMHCVLEQELYNKMAAAGLFDTLAVYFSTELTAGEIRSLNRWLFGLIVDG